MEDAEEPCSLMIFQNDVGLELEKFGKDGIVVHGSRIASET